KRLRGEINKMDRVSSEISLTAFNNAISITNRSAVTTLYEFYNYKEINVIS
ncbi:hypothetical protein L9F63_007574, partial [Diploptera punctata]